MDPLGREARGRRGGVVLAVVALVLGLGLAVACDEQRSAILICHNSNCARATEPNRDDTLASLRESLALRYQGRPVIDGIELDSLWVAELGGCYFGHDFATLGADPPTGLDAAQLLVEHFAQPTDFISWGGNRFYTKIELKEIVTAAGATHDAEQVQQHAGCVLEIAEALISAARDNGRELELQFESWNLALIRAVVADARWPGKEPYPGISLRLVAPSESPDLVPEDLTSLRSEADDLGIDILSFHTSRYPTHQRQSYYALDVDLMLWMLDASLETFHVIGIYKPKYVVTSEALLFRRWLEF